MKKLIIFVLFASLLASCNKKDKTCNQDAAGVSGTYKITAVTYKATAGSAEQDYYSFLFPDACQRDDQWIFSSNGTYVYSDAGVKCVPPGDDNGTWSINGNTITIDGDPATVQSFNCSALVVVATDINVVGDQLKITFARQ